MFNFFIYDLISILSNISFVNFTNDTTPYVTGDGAKEGNFEICKNRHPEVFLEKSVLKYAANLQENTHAEV